MYTVSHLSTCAKQQYLRLWISQLTWQGVSNLNDLPTSTFPVTRVDASQDSQVAAHDFRSKLDKDIYERCEWTPVLLPSVSDIIY